MTIKWRHADVRESSDAIACSCPKRRAAHLGTVSVNNSISIIIVQNILPRWRIELQPAGLNHLSIHTATERRRPSERKNQQPQWNLLMSSDQNEKSTRQKGRISGGVVAVCIITAAVFLGGGYWLVTGFGKLSRAIMPGSGITKSTSMKPVDLVFRAGYYFHNGRANTAEKPLEWHLRIPKAYVVSKHGSSSAVGGGVNSRSFHVRLSAVLDQKTLDLKPGALAKNYSSNPFEFDIRLSNRVSRIRSISENNCMDAKDRSVIFNRKYSCNTDFKCEVTMQVEDWGVYLLLRKNKMHERAKFCKAASKFLKKHTISVDRGVQ